MDAPISNYLTDLLKSDFYSGSREVSLDWQDTNRNSDTNLSLKQDPDLSDSSDSDDILAAFSEENSNDDDVISLEAKFNTDFAEAHYREAVSVGNTERFMHDPNMSAPFDEGSNWVVGEMEADDITNFAPNRDDTDSQLLPMKTPSFADDYLPQPINVITTTFHLDYYEGVHLELNMGEDVRADLRLIRDANQNGVEDAGEFVASSTAPGSNDEHINNITLSGDYLVERIVYQSGSGYLSLGMQHFSTPHP